MSTPVQWPSVSLVTPSYNQGRFLDAAIRSVTAQRYPRLEYVIMDGGSTDESRDIINAHASMLHHWVSQADAGQYDAINRGFHMTNGEVMGWLNSDDMLAPWALSVVGEIFARYPEIEWLTTLLPFEWNEQGQLVGCHARGGYTARQFRRGVNLVSGRWYARGWIQQESTFWRRSLWERTGGRLDTTLTYAADFDLWARFFREAELYTVAVPLGGFRVHDAQKTAAHLQEYVREAEQVFTRFGGVPYHRVEGRLRAALWQSMGSRAFRSIPAWIHAILVRHELLEPFKLCRWDGEQWIVATEYMF